MKCIPLFHRWTKWEPYDWRGFQYPLRLLSDTSKQEPREISMRRQRRHCEKCGKEQDELVRNG